MSLRKLCPNFMCDYRTPRGLKGFVHIVYSDLHLTVSILRLSIHALSGNKHGLLLLLVIIVCTYIPLKHIQNTSNTLSDGFNLNNCAINQNSKYYLHNRKFEKVEMGEKWLA